MAGIWSTGIRGLDRTLGGGLRLFPKTDNAPPSGVLLLRGPPGAGKSVLATRIAAHLAGQLEGDVLYACIEILPSELQAQLESFSWGTKKPVFIDLHGTNPVSRGEAPLLFCGLLDLEPSGRELHLKDALEALKNAALKAHGRPRVLVLDSLSSGYQLGREAPRALVDALCKLSIELGWCFLFLEETTTLEPSPWSFASDTVLELGMQDLPGDGWVESARSLRVSKHRFGHSTPGPHFFDIQKEGIFVHPSCNSYTIHSIKRVEVNNDANWSVRCDSPSAGTMWHLNWKSPSNSCHLVFGNDSRLVSASAHSMSFSTAQAHSMLLHLGGTSGGSFPVP